MSEQSSEAQIGVETTLTVCYSKNDSPINLQRRKVVQALPDRRLPRATDVQIWKHPLAPSILSTHTLLTYLPEVQSIVKNRRICHHQAKYRVSSSFSHLTASSQ